MGSEEAGGENLVVAGVGDVGAFAEDGWLALAEEEPALAGGAEDDEGNEEEEGDIAQSPG